MTWLRRLIGVLLMVSALALAWVRAPDRPVETLVARWAPAPSAFIDLRGQLVHLRDEGPRDDPEPLVLLHGTASSLHTWEGWTQELRATRRVVSFDLPGFGLTGPFTGAYDRDDYRGDTYARFVLDVLDQLQLARVVLAGHSLGGEIAWRVAAAAPRRVSRLILIGATGPAFEPLAEPLAFRLLQAPVLGWLGQHLLPRSLVVEGLVSAVGDPDRIRSEQVDRHYELALREGNRQALALRRQQARRGEHAERIAGLRLPALLLWGGRDRWVPPAVGQQFAALIPGSRLQVFDTLGHIPQEEDPARTLVPVLAFLGPH